MNKDKALKSQGKREINKTLDIVEIPKISLLLPYDILLHLFQFITIKSLLNLSFTCTYYRNKLQNENYCFRLTSLYGNW